MDKNTRLSELLDRYPWLRKEAASIDERLKIIDSPLGRMLVGKMTVKDAAEKVGLDPDELARHLEGAIAAHDEGISVAEYLRSLEGDPYDKMKSEKGSDTMDKYVCGACGYVYDPEVGDPDNGIAPGTAFEDLPEDWTCPLCGVGKDMFAKAE